MHLKSLIAIAALAVAELGLLAFAATPDVSADYRAYYIDRTTGCVPVRASGEYQLGTTISLDQTDQRSFEAIATCGFGDSGRRGAWLLGPEARLHFLRTPDMTSDLVLDIDARANIDATWPRHHADVTANGEAVGKLDYPDAEQRLQSVTIPRRLFENRDALDITLTMTDTRVPGAPTSQRDSRRNSIFVRAIRLGPAQ